MKETIKKLVRRVFDAIDRIRRKRSDEEVARIMEAVWDLAVLSSDFAVGECKGSAVDAAYANVERLVRGEKS